VLARTGQNPVQFAAAGAGLLMIGYVLVRGTRRRQRVYLP
jgi:LPXTG-motif cell wall-anchored protein